MNYCFISAGLFLFISLLIKLITGDKENKVTNPKRQKFESDMLSEIWLIGGGALQLVSVDIGLTPILIFLMGVGIIPHNFYLSLFIALFYAEHLIFWLLSASASSPKYFSYLKQGQWMLFLSSLDLFILGVSELTKSIS